MIALRRRMSRLVRAAAVAALPIASLLGSGHADAAPPVTALVSPPPVTAFSTLPSGKVPQPPKKKPFAVGAHERVAGFFLAQQGENHQATMVAGSRQELDRIMGRAKPSPDGEDQDTREFCFSEGRENHRVDVNAPSAERKSTFEWAGHMQPFVGLYAQSGRHVEALHREHLVDEGGGKATLDIVDAWVDAVTRGARLIGKSKLAMQLVTTAPGNIQVFAARDEGRVHVVVVEPKSTARRWQGIINTSAEGINQSSCRHSRVTLAAERGSAETTTFLVTAELGPAEADTKPEGPSAEDDSSAPQGFERVRSRPLHIHASVSWASLEKEPIMSVSVGWEARDRTDNSFRPRKFGKKK